MKITKLTPNFEVTDVKKSVAYYTENFGFKLIMTVPATQDAIEHGLMKLLASKSHPRYILNRRKTNRMFKHKKKEE
jgi:uncharacterized glyoxalase superfamily protein PhnB